MRRRRFVSALASAAAASATGCLDKQEAPDGEEPGDDDGARYIPGIGDPPQRVYHPTHSDPMEMAGSATAGDYEVTVMYTLPHRFWTVTGSRIQRVDPTADDDVHLMVVVSDAESGVVLPVDAGVSVELSKDGEAVYDRSPWTMISQRMGFHYGDNASLDGDGEYELTVSIGSLADVSRAGDLDDRFQQSAEASFRLELQEDKIQEMSREARYFPESRWGVAEALPPMSGYGGGSDGEGGTPYSSVPAPENLPGELLGAAEEDDAVYALSVVPGPSRFADGDYLMVSPRTPYNRCVLPSVALELASGESLSPTLDFETGLHYGAAVEEMGRREQVEVVVVTPPQVSRHMGYETAFLDMDSVTVEASGGD